MHGALASSERDTACAAQTIVSPMQLLVLSGLAAVLAAGFFLSPHVPPLVLTASTRLPGRCRLAARRALLTRRPPKRSVPELVTWPRYTIIAALYDEAAIVPQR